MSFWVRAADGFVEIVRSEDENPPEGARVFATVEQAAAVGSQRAEEIAKVQQAELDSALDPSDDLTARSRMDLVVRGLALLLSNGDIQQLRQSGFVSEADALQAVRDDPR